MRIAQTNWQGPKMTEDNWRHKMAMKVAEFDWNKLIADVKPFVEKQNDLQLLNNQNLAKLLLL